MELWELTARELVRDTIARYAHLVDRGRLDEVAALFTEDAVLEAGDEPPAHGRAAIRALFAGVGARLAAGGRARIRHHVSSIAIAFADPWTATAESYFLAVMETGPDHWGRYRDRLVLRDGRWLFMHRRVRVDGRVAARTP